MKRIGMLTILMSAAILLSVVLDSQAGTARVRCQIRSGRVKIQIDGLDLPVGTYGARVKNARTGSIVKTEATKVVKVISGVDDIDLDFDTEVSPTDSFVSASFAKVGDTVRASVVKISTGVVVAAASATCVKR
jgi:hypothetical protein